MKAYSVGGSGIQAYSSGIGLIARGGVYADGSPTGSVLSGDGIRGIANGPSASGVYGIEGTGGWAGRFDGDVIYSGTLSAVSDLRLKRDVRPLAYGLDEIKALKPIAYYLKDDADNTPRLGLIAQEVQLLIPEIVNADGPTDWLSLAYVELIPVLIRAIQEQQVQIETLSANGPAAETAHMAEAGTPQVTVIRQSVGPSNAAIYTGAGSVLVFALGLFAVSGALFWRRARRS